MKVEKITRIYLPFKDHFKKQKDDKKQQRKKKTVEQSKEKKDSHFIGWA
jgi:hypothetical protein